MRSKQICRLSGKTRDDVIFELQVEEQATPWRDEPPNYGVGNIIRQIDRQHKQSKIIAEIC